MLMQEVYRCQFHDLIFRLCMEIAGQELKRDSRLVQEVGLVEGHQVHAISTPHANSYTELTPEAAEEQLSASPTVLLSQEVHAQHSFLMSLPICALRNAAEGLVLLQKVHA